MVTHLNMTSAETVRRSTGRVSKQWLAHAGARWGCGQLWLAPQPGGAAQVCRWPYVWLQRRAAGGSRWQPHDY